MGIGAGVFLIAIGAILAFAVDYTANGVDIAAVGWILMAAGVLGILLDLIVFAPRRRDTARTDGPVVEERRVYDDRVRATEPAQLTQNHVRGLGAAYSAP